MLPSNIALSIGHTQNRHFPSEWNVNEESVAETQEKELVSTQRAWEQSEKNQQQQQLWIRFDAASFRNTLYWTEH